MDETLTYTCRNNNATELKQRDRVFINTVFYLSKSGLVANYYIALE